MHEEIVAMKKMKSFSFYFFLYRYVRVCTYGVIFKTYEVPVKELLLTGSPLPTPLGRENPDSRFEQVPKFLTSWNVGTGQSVKHIKTKLVMGR